MYCERRQLNLIYGRINIEQWADLDNDKDSQAIEDRIAYAIENACAYVDGRLKSSPYKFPIVDETVPTIISHAAALKAGMMLYDGRRVATDETEDQVSAQQAELNDILNRILANTLALALDRVSTKPIKVYPRPAVDSRMSDGI